MFKPLSKLLILIIMLLTFVGQAMASQFFLSQDKFTQTEQAESVAAALTTQSDVHVDNEDDCCEVECCEDECVCPLNSCASLNLVYLSDATRHIHLSSENIVLQSNSPPKSIAKALFRPPIFTSQG